MNYRNKWIGLSLIALAVFSACTDEVENGGLRPGKGDHSLSFAVSTPGWQAFTKADGTHAASAPATQELEPVEMEGKVNGKTVYLTAEVAEGFPSDRQPMTRGTQVTDANKTNDGIMQTFAVSAYTDKTGKPDFMYSVPTTKGSPENGTTYWYPEEKFYWPGVKTLNFYAWYPHAANAEGLTVSGADQNGAPTLHYIVPDDVKKQMDVMTAVASDQSEQEAIPLTFNHALAAVKFVAGNDLPECTVNSVTIKNVKYKGSYNLGTGTWELQNDVTNFSVNIGKGVDGTEDVAVTGDDQTFFMMPQEFVNHDARIEVNLTIKGEECILNAFLKDIHLDAATGESKYEKGKTYIYRISYPSMSVDVTFFKDRNGVNGAPYTSHNISANGDPFWVDMKCPSVVTKATLRFAYETTDASGNTTYSEIKKDYVLPNGKGQSSTRFISPCMNNTALAGYGKDKPTAFVIQVKIASQSKVMMVIDSDPMVFYPDLDSETWYTVWRGTMYPPNAAIAPKNEITSYTLCARKDAYNGQTCSYYSALNVVRDYWEVDVNHPIYGLGRWSLPYCFWSVAMVELSYLIGCANPVNRPLGWDSTLAGEPFGQTIYWTSGGSGGDHYWGIRRTLYRTSDGDWLKHHADNTDYQLAVFSGTNSRLGVRGYVYISENR